MQKIAMLLSSGADHVYDGTVYSFQEDFVGFLGLENAGIVTAHGSENKSEAKRREARMLGASL